MSSSYPRSALRLCAFGSLAIATLGFSGCSREERRFSEPAASAASQGITLSELSAGLAASPPAPDGPYDHNAYAISQGARLYDWMNCSGCHAHGGGNIGPALMDDRWLYGSAAPNIYAAIVEGRPNGMPAFRGKLKEQEVWQLVAYVRSLSGQLQRDAEPGRTDHLFDRDSPQSTQTLPPIEGGTTPP
jgi:cytochrome c oxidase cbb3-type subunit 3